MEHASDHVRVRNEGEADFTVRFDSRDYTIPVGGDAIIPREAACKDFGNWEAQDGSRNDFGVVGDWRKLEYERIRGLYGALDGMGGADERFKSNRPRVRIWDGDTEVSTVLDDPKGEKLPMLGAPDSRKDAELDALKAQVAELRDLVGKGVSYERVAGDDIPTDTPERAPRRKRQPAQVQAADVEE